MANDNQPPSKSGTSKRPRLKTLFDYHPPLTPEQAAEFEAERRRRGKAQWDAMYKWTDREIVQYIDAFKMQRPEQYAEYMRQEIETGKIDSSLATDMHRFAHSMFPTVTLIDCTNLFGEVRRHVRGSLNLTW